MRLYKVTRRCRGRKGLSGMVVAAANQTVARYVFPIEDFSVWWKPMLQKWVNADGLVQDYRWDHPEQVDVKFLGTAADEYDETTVIMISYYRGLYE